jgi:hypothetical protein
MSTIKLLGGVQIIVIIGTVVAERQLATIVGSGRVPEILGNISEIFTRVRTSNLDALCLNAAIVAENA